MLNYGDKGKMHKYWENFTSFVSMTKLWPRGRMWKKQLSYTRYTHLSLSLLRSVMLVYLNSDVVSWWCKALTFWKIMYKPVQLLNNNGFISP